MRPFEQVRALAHECALRVKQRADYCSDNEHAVAHRRAEELELVRRIMQKAKRRKSK
jgi:hypothetical protein